MNRRAGFALITVLWVLVVAAAIATAGAAAGHDAAAALKNRVNATRAYWRANGCAERARFAIDRALSDAAIEHRDSLWRAIGTPIGTAPHSAAGRCSLRFVAAGSQLNMNTASEADLQRLFEAMAFASPASLTASLLDWIDGDDNPRRGGAESATYEAMRRRLPRNAPVASGAELRCVLGFEDLEVDSVLAVDSARISIATAPLPVLAVLPGFGPEVLARIAQWRAIGRQVSNLLVLADAVSPSAANALLASFPEILRRATLDPESWVVIANGTSGYPPIASTIELRIVRAQSRAALLARRVW